MAWRLISVWVLTLGAAVLLPNYSGDPAKAADFPCEKTNGVAAQPKAPTGLKIIGRLLEPLLGSVPVFAGTVTNAYYDSLATRADCLKAYSLRSQELLNALQTLNTDSPKKKPITYDALEDAAKISIYPPDTTDIQGKLLPMSVQAGSMLLTYDFKFDENFRWLGEGYMARHKTWRVDPGPWVALRTDYRHAAQVGQFGELFITLPGAKYAVDGRSWRQQDDPKNPLNFNGWIGEMLQPAVGVFYYPPNTWARVWVYVESMDKPIWSLSIWAAHETRDPVLMYNNVALHPADGAAISDFRIGYDTSADQAKFPAKTIYAWNRNVVVLHNISKTTVMGLLKRPGA